MCEKCEKFSKNLLKKNRGVALPINLSPRMKKKVIGDYIKIKKDYHDKLIGNMQLLMAGRITKAEYLTMQKEAMKLAFTEAYANGKVFGQGHYNGLDETERRFVGYQVKREMDYMSKFADDIITGSGKMPYVRRMGMYSDSLDAMFGFGRLVYMPEEAKILWNLGETDKHCLDCIVFNAKNPYTKKSLPGYPKSGASRCLSNCKCSLLYLYTNTMNSGDYDTFIVKNFNQKGDLPSEEQYFDLMTLRNEFYYNKGMFAITGLKEYQDNCNSIKRRFTEYKTRYNLYISDAFPVRRFLGDIKEFNTNTKFSLVTASTDVNTSDMISFFAGDKQIYGKVVGRYDKFIRIKLMDKSELMIDPKNSILFREK